ncbi:MAG: hypothetical protein ABS79_01270 [Planctomycetes bacterium SCN 63-9]|nr:MAG: hypothetical protein ABS79_01270 [Planctomycetes bacterium SCN 63-9]
MTLTFPSITKVSRYHYEPAEDWRFYFLRDSSGTVIQRQWELPQGWTGLRQQAAEDQGNDLPKLIKENPIGYLCFLMVYPHRVNASGLRWISSRLQEL